MGRPSDLPVETLLCVQAPMVGLSDLPFRVLCARWGATLTYTAMFHTTPFLSNRDFRERALRDLALGRSLCAASSSAPGSAPVVGQLAGNDAPALVEAGKLLGGLVDALELNLGCPQQRAKEGHYGAYLLAKKDLPLVTSLVSALTTLAVPAHVKYRLPPSPASASEYACALAQAGARTLTLHARPAGSPSRRRDLYGLRVPAIGETRKALDGEGWGEVRLVGNGGVRERADVDRLRDEAGVEGWMVGEHLAGNHRFFDSTQAGARALELADEYLTLVETCPSDLVPLQSVQRHVRNFVEGDLLSAHTRVRKTFLQDLEACADLAAVRALCESETIVEAWAPAVSAEE